MSSPLPSVAVIGMGFAGGMAFTHLVRRAQKPLRIFLIDPAAEMGLGLAYSTSASYHLLNVRADRISAFADQPNDFYDWLSSPAAASGIARFCPGRQFLAGDYVPRPLYGVYIKDILQRAMREAEEKRIQVTRYTKSAVKVGRIAGKYHVALANGDEISADMAILACGNLPPRHFSFASMLAEDTRYIPDIWRPPVNSLFPNRVSELAPASEIVIIGTGLTTVDAVLTLRKEGYRGRITAISRHGLLPAVHKETAPYPNWELTQCTTDSHTSYTALGLLRALRRESKNAANWRDVVDSLRPVTQDLWANLSEAEKKRMVRLLPYWNIHRHRMAPEIYDTLQALMQSGVLRIIPGKVEKIISAQDGLLVSFRKRYDVAPQEVTAECVLNCTGPELDITKSRHVLLQQLLHERVLVPGPAGMGVKAATEEPLFLLGSLRTGELLESTAVPELRLQAQEVADKILSIL